MKSEREANVERRSLLFGAGAIAAVATTPAIEVYAKATTVEVGAGALGSDYANRPLAATYDAAPSIILPPSTAMIDIHGKSAMGDYADKATYRAVTVEPSHQGKIKIGSRWFELLEQHVMPDWFIRTGDTDDRASAQRASDFMSDKGVVNFILGPRPYDWSSGQVSFNHIAVQIMGAGFTESGLVNGWNSNNSNYTENARGTWIKAGLVGSNAITFSGGNARGASIDKVGFIQAQPDASGSAWSPTDYGYLIENVNSLGGLDIGRVCLLGITRGILNNNSGRLEVHNLTGQVFKNAIDIDRAYDTSYINRIWLYPLDGGKQPIMHFIQDNLELLRLGRVDGLNANTIGGYTGNKGVHCYDGGHGPATGITINSTGFDFTKWGLYLDSPNCNGWIGYFRCQCEAQPSTGTGVAGSGGIWATAKAAANNWAFGKAYIDRPGGAGLQLDGAASVVLDFAIGLNIVNAGRGVPLAHISGSNNLVRLGTREGTDGTGVRGDIDDPTKVLRAMSIADSTLGNYADDQAAASGRVPIGGLYVRLADHVVVRRAT